MVSSISGNYIAPDYSLRSETVKPFNQSGSMNECPEKKNGEIGQITSNLNQLPPSYQVNTVAKTEEIAEENVSANQSDDPPPNDISTLISLIESSRTRRVESPESQGADTRTDDPQKNAVLNERVDNVNKVDADSSNEITRNEALDFINQQS